MACITPCLENGKIARYCTAGSSESAPGSTEFIVIRGRPEVTDTNFTFDLTKSGMVRQYAIGQMTGTSGHQIFPANALEYLTVAIPSLPEPCTIARFLGELDNKLKSNLSRIDTLEAMAQSIFKDWFVDFGPTRAKTPGRTPYLTPKLWDLFPDTPDATEIGEIPEGWNYQSVSELAKIKRGKHLPQKEYIERGALPVLGDAGIMGHPNHHNSESFIITVGHLGAYNGPFFSYRGKAGINNNASLIMPGELVSGEWFLLALQTLDVNLVKKGAAHPLVSNSEIASMKVVYPETIILNQFHRYITPIKLKRVRSTRKRCPSPNSRSPTPETQIR